MCTPCEDVLGETVGVRLQLCDTYWNCLAQLLRLPLDNGPAKEVLRAFDVKQGFALIEWDYYDIDFRSEYSTIQETSASVSETTAQRVHFFRCRGDASWTMLQFLQRVAKEQKKKKWQRDTLSDSPNGLREPFVGGRSSRRKRRRPDLSDQCYRGYIVVRPTEPRTIGRSLVYPGFSLPEMTANNELHEHIRTACIEIVNVFGVALKAYGVPFMQQDGALLRCAHVAAWMAHYTSVLHGAVPRRPSARFNTAEDPRRSYGRTLPSSGLSSESQSQILERLDLPPEVWNYEGLIEPRQVGWFDRTELADAAARLALRQTELQDPEHKESLEGVLEQERRLWFAENLTSRVARYLNSGIPVILNGKMRAPSTAPNSICIHGEGNQLPRQPEAMPSDNGSLHGDQQPTAKGRARYGSHSVMICGYLRQRDTNLSSTAGVDLTTLIAQDDQLGPFRPLKVDDLFAAGYKRLSRLNLLVPLPAGLWLTGTDAEAWAAQQYPNFVQQAYLHATGDDSLDDAGAAYRQRLVEILKELNQTMNADPGERNFALRSYAVDASAFKQSFARRVADEESSHLVSYLGLPRYVWVVEVLDRRKRHENRGRERKRAALDVWCSMVLDGSAVTERLTRKPHILMVHVPGFIAVPPPPSPLDRPELTVGSPIASSADSVVDDRDPNFQWMTSAVGPLESGRWSHFNSIFKSATFYAAHAKAAVAWDRYR